MEEDERPLPKRADEVPVSNLIWLEPLGFVDPDNLTFDQMIEVEAERNGS